MSESTMIAEITPGPPATSTRPPLLLDIDFIPTLLLASLLAAQAAGDSVLTAVYIRRLRAIAIRVRFASGRNRKGART